MTAQAQAVAAPGERIGTPSVGDVIVSEAFVNGWRRLVQPDVPEDGPMWVTDAPDRLRQMVGMPKQDCLDATRSSAQFVVEDVTWSRSGVRWTETSRGGGYGDPFTYEEERHAYALHVTARRLRADGTYDPAGERIQFEAWGSGPSNDRGVSRCLSEVRRSGNPTLTKTVLDAPIYRVRTMRPFVRFE